MTAKSRTAQVHSMHVGMTRQKTVPVATLRWIVLWRQIDECYPSSAAENNEQKALRTPHLKPMRQDVERRGCKTTEGLSLSSRLDAVKLDYRRRHKTNHRAAGQSAARSSAQRQTRLRIDLPSFVGPGQLLETHSAIT